ncbi:MAG: dynamin [Anaerolineales bacterium]|nr:GTP-binding protein [Anaerolineae bacterium]PWB55804.1 MAG: dynamin [Anaerolineales bacterium]
MRILNDAQENLLKDSRNVLNDLRSSLVQFGATSEDHKTLADSIRQLDELFLLVVVGEFNSGKSAFINALLGQNILKEGVTPTTTQINVLQFGQTIERHVENENLHTLTAPVELLAELNIVDTPGTNAIIRQHESITQQFVPRSDLVLFVTSADRPFTESERSFLENIRDWGKKVVIVLNKIDLFQSAEEQQQVVSYISDNSRSLLGITPEIFPVSSRLALRAKLGEPALWQSSQFETLEQYIQITLDEKGRLSLKFMNPLGVATHLVNKYLEVTNARLGLLKTDFATLSDVDAQLNVYQQDMRHNFGFRMSDIDNVLYEMEQRGQDYFDETLRLPRVLDLLNKSRIQKEFEQRVVADVPQKIETKVNEMIDWLVEANLRQWQAVMEHIADRRREHEERIIGDAAGGSFHYDREKLIEGVGREAQRVVEGYDREVEARLMAEGAQTAVAALAATEVGAIGLGALIAVLATTAAADATGILLASVIALLGLFIIPAKKRQAKVELRQKIADLRQQLTQSLRTQFEREMERGILNIQDAIAPYSRFVRAEQGKLEQVQSKLDETKNGLEKLKVQVQEVINL